MTIVAQTLFALVVGVSPLLLLGGALYFTASEPKSGPTVSSEPLSELNSDCGDSTDDVISS